MSESSGRNGDGAVDFFRDRFGLDDRTLTAALDMALERNAEYADLFFEYTTQDSVSLEEGIVKSGDRHLEQGVGVRAQVGERQGYAHTDEVTVESLHLAASTARTISQESRTSQAVAIGGATPVHDLYPVDLPPTDVPVAHKVELLGEIDVYARGLDTRVTQVMASVVCQQQTVLVAGSDGTLAGDVRPLVRLNVQVIVADPSSSRREIGYQGTGGLWSQPLHLVWMLFSFINTYNSVSVPLQSKCNGSIDIVRVSKRRCRLQ